MVLRRLELSDIQGMLDWMKDEQLNCNFRQAFGERTEEQVEDFIKKTWKDMESRVALHYAITENGGEYLGTISLKNIDKVNSEAEYAIVMRPCGQKKGLATLATKEILRIAFEELNLGRVYLNVLSDNMRARRLYEKCGFAMEGKKDSIIVHNEKKELCWYTLRNRKNKQAKNG